MNDPLEKIADLRRHMRQSAQVQDWDSVVALDAACVPLFEMLRQSPPAQWEPARSRGQLASLMRQILDDEAAVVNLAGPRLSALRALLQPPAAAGPAP